MYCLSFYVGQELGEGTVGIAFPYSILTGASAEKTQKFRGNSVWETGNTYKVFTHISGGECY